MGLRISITGALLGLGSIATLGCGSDAEVYCDNVCACTGCSASQRQKCSDDAEVLELKAEQNDCLPEHDTLAACLVDNFDCVSDTVVLPPECAGETVELLECQGTENDG
jgi:hypothetical protein